MTGAPRAPHIASLAFPGLPAEPLLHALEARGVFASAGSACASRTAGPSPTLKAIGVDDRTAVLRFSLSRAHHRGGVDGDAGAGRGGRDAAVAARPPSGRTPPHGERRPLPLRRAVPQEREPPRVRARARGQRARRVGRTAARPRRADPRSAAGAAARDDADEAAARLARVFGLVSLSVARQVDQRRSGGDHRRGRRRGPRRGGARAPGQLQDRARRVGQALPGGSTEIDRSSGRAVAAATGLPVDVHTPACGSGSRSGRRRITCTPARAWRPAACPSAAPGRALLLLSGGIDSPVAGWLAAKRGLALDAVYFHSPPYIGEKSRDKVLALGKQLARWQALRFGDRRTVHGCAETLRDAGPAELAVVLYRRMMMRIADEIADRLEASALVTGENLGQVASQTIENLTAIEAAARRSRVSGRPAAAIRRSSPRERELQGGPSRTQQSHSSRARMPHTSRRARCPS